MRWPHVLWDCDGVLIDSETPAFVACCSVMNQILGSKGIDFQWKPGDLQDQFAGRQAREIVQELARLHRFDLTADEITKVEADELAAVMDILGRNAQMTAGVDQILTRLRDAGHQQAVVSSSALDRLKVSLQCAGLYDHFDPNWIISAKSLPGGKKSPEVYLHACDVVGNGFAPGRFVAIEDSVPGALAAVGAGITLIGYIGAFPRVHEDSSEHARRKRDLLAAGAAVVVDTWDPDLFFRILRQMFG